MGTKPKKPTTKKPKKLKPVNGDPGVLAPAENAPNENLNKLFAERNVVIIHYNTPELTQAAILSLRKHGGAEYKVTVFDNSDKRPFPKMEGVKILNNTKGRYFNFDKELDKYPDRCPDIGCARGCVYGSAKHMMTVQKLWDLFPNGFVLMESDILLKRNIDSFFNYNYSFVAHVQYVQPYNPAKLGRIMPLLCWFNVPLLKKEGALYYDPQRTYGLLPGGKQNKNNWYDTGAVLLEDVLNKRPRLKGLHVDIRPYLVHYTSGSWQNNDINAHQRWLLKHAALWK